MAIHFISGKPGGGKSLYALKLVVEELLYGVRPIITNLPIRVGELNAYFQAQYPGRSVDVVSRVWLLNDDQTGEFWTWRPGGVRIKHLARDEWALGQKPSYGAVVDSGVMYVIDEIHNYFGARQWASTGQDVLFYLSQHRKLGDTVVCITQAVGNVDRQFRSVSQDFTFLRNLNKEQYGVFRLPAIFLRKTFTSPPTEKSEPMETGTFRLDVKGLCACYDSAVGVGIHGRGADLGEKRRGASYLWFFVGVVALVLVLFGVVPKVMASFLKPLTVVPATAAAAAPPVSAVPPVPVVPPVAPVAPVAVASVAPVPAVPPVAVVVMTSYVRVPSGGYVVGLSDGRLFRPGSKEVESASWKGATIEGTFYPARR